MGGAGGRLIGSFIEKVKFLISGGGCGDYGLSSSTNTHRFKMSAMRGIHAGFRKWSKYPEDSASVDSTRENVLGYAQKDVRTGVHTLCALGGY